MDADDDVVRENIKKGGDKKFGSIVTAFFLASEDNDGAGCELVDDKDQDIGDCQKFKKKKVSMVVDYTRRFDPELETDFFLMDGGIDQLRSFAESQHATFEFSSSDDDDDSDEDATGSDDDEVTILKRKLKKTEKRLTQAEENNKNVLDQVAGNGTGKKASLEKTKKELCDAMSALGGSKTASPEVNCENFMSFVKGENVKKDHTQIHGIYTSVASHMVDPLSLAEAPVDGFCTINLTEAIAHKLSSLGVPMGRKRNGLLKCRFENIQDHHQASVSRVLTRCQEGKRAVLVSDVPIVAELIAIYLTTDVATRATYRQIRCAAAELLNMTSFPKNFAFTACHESTFKSAADRHERLSPCRRDDFDREDWSAVEEAMGASASSGSPPTVDPTAGEEGGNLRSLTAAAILALQKGVHLSPPESGKKGRKCFNCGLTGHSWQKCRKPIDQDRVRKAAKKVGLKEPVFAE